MTRNEAKAKFGLSYLEGTCDASGRVSIPVWAVVYILESLEVLKFDHDRSPLPASKSVREQAIRALTNTGVRGAGRQCAIVLSRDNAESIADNLSALGFEIIKK